MKVITATELARNFRNLMDLVEYGQEEMIVVRNRHPVARIVPGPISMTALEAMADLYRTLPEAAAETWLRDSRTSGSRKPEKVRDPWAS